jgi:hypothetical protein
MPDYDRNEILRRASLARSQYKGGDIYFKFTCEKCGERCTFDQPNYLFEFGECCACGHSQKITQAGFALMARILAP